MRGHGRPQEASPLRAGVRGPPLVLSAFSLGHGQSWPRCWSRGGCLSASHNPELMLQPQKPSALRQSAGGSMSHLCGQLWRKDPHTKAAVYGNVWEGEEQLE